MYVNPCNHESSHLLHDAYEVISSASDLFLTGSRFSFQSVELPRLLTCGETRLNDF